jgi:hypothetical protein
MLRMRQRTTIWTLISIRIRYQMDQIHMDYHSKQLRRLNSIYQARFQRLGRLIHQE